MLGDKEVCILVSREGKSLTRHPASPDKDGRRYGAIESVRDVSAHKRAEEALRKKEEEFRQSQKLEAVGSLAGGMAHEFNNLLQAIRAFTTFADEGTVAGRATLPGSARGPQGVGKGGHSYPPTCWASAAASSFSRPTCGLNEILVRPGEDVAAADRRKHRTATDPRRRRLGAVARRPDHDPAGGDESLHQRPRRHARRRQAAHPDRGRRAGCGRLPVERQQPAGTLRAADGLRYGSRHARPTCSKRIFEPFFSTKGVGKGTGLGLSMVYGVVQQHGGMIRVRSEPGQGATFEIDLPAVEAAAEAAVAGGVRAPSAAGAETILMAEDDPLVRAALVRVLTEAGYRVLAAADGEEAVKVFADNSGAIALVLLDMMMPKMGGREAHAQIAEINPDTPVVYCTGYDSGLAKLDSAETAGLCVVQKPVDPAVLLSTIRELLDRRTLCLAE